MGSRGNFYYAMHWVGNNGGSDNESLIVTGGIIALIIAVLAGGFWNGIYTHILLTTGYDVSSNETIILNVFNVTCNAFGNIPNGQQSASLCQQTYSEAKSEVNLEGFIEFILPILLLIVAITALIAGFGDSPWFIAGGIIIGLISSVLLNSVGYAVGFALMGGNSNIPIHTTSTTTISITSKSTSSTSSSTTTIIYRGTCKAYQNFTCSNSYLSADNKLTMTLSENLGISIYNLQIGCGTTTESNGKPIAEFYDLTFNLSSGKSVQVSNVICSGAYNGTFDGFVWLNYTRLPSRPFALNNSYFESEIASVNIS